jgi:CTP synthase (UTP-ammonia lyase)
MPAAPRGVALCARRQGYCYPELMAAPTISVIGDHDPGRPAHAALDRALACLPHGVTASWVATDAVAEPATQLAAVDGLWIAPGSPYRSFDGALRAIQYARERNLPLFGT